MKITIQDFPNETINETTMTKPIEVITQVLTRSEIKNNDPARKRNGQRATSKKSKRPDQDTVSA